MVAAVHQKIAARVGELAFFDVFDPCAVDADGYVVFGLARYRAGVAANALALVYYEGVFGHACFRSTW